MFGTKFGKRLLVIGDSTGFKFYFGDSQWECIQKDRQNADLSLDQCSQFLGRLLTSIDGGGICDGSVTLDMLV